MNFSIDDLFTMQQIQLTKNTKNLTIKGWVRSNRNSKNVGFLDINDGSTIKVLQVVYNIKNAQWKILTTITTGSAVIINGDLTLTPKSNQPFEMQLKTITIINSANSDFPIQKKEHSHEFLRENAHLRIRTNTFLAIMRVRNQTSWAIHKFFQQEKFIYLHSPIITANDAEGAGENFIVTTITNNNYQSDFFAKKASLTVSGQLNAEAYAQALQKVYTFGPTFRAENSNTTRHAAEFWMIEPEFTFASLNDNMQLAQKLVKFIINDLLTNCYQELTFFSERLATINASDNTSQQEKPLSLLAKLKTIADDKIDFKVITYSEVITLLLAAKKAGKTFIFNDIKWGMDLQSEHERYLCEEVTNCPTFVINYPQAIKAFYMKLNQSDANNSQHKTVAAMDLLVPGIGELIGGSVREDNYQQLLLNKKQFNINGDDLQWYFDLRKYGYAPSAGFGLGLERLLMFVTGINNIRDVIPFPRTPNNLLF